MATNDTPNSPLPPVREPHWPVLAHDLNWIGLWSSPSSAVKQYVDSLEARLHNPNVTDHLDIIATRARLDAYRWLHETVNALAEKSNAREVASLAVALSPPPSSMQQRSRWRRAADFVLPPILG